jgi:hypothetical protein
MDEAIRPAPSGQEKQTYLDIHLRARRIRPMTERGKGRPWHKARTGLELAAEAFARDETEDDIESLELAAEWVLLGLPLTEEGTVPVHVKDGDEFPTAREYVERVKARAGEVEAEFDPAPEFRYKQGPDGFWRRVT